MWRFARLSQNPVARPAFVFAHVSRGVLGMAARVRHLQRAAGPVRRRRGRFARRAATGSTAGACLDHADRLRWVERPAGHFNAGEVVVGGGWSWLGRG